MQNIINFILILFYFIYIFKFFDNELLIYLKNKNFKTVKKSEINSFS
jgi:hypothetical protein